MSAEAPQSELTLETEEEMRARLGVERDAETAGGQQRMKGITGEEVHRENVEHAQAQKKIDQKELSRVWRSLSQRAEEAGIKSPQPSKEEMRGMPEESFLNAFSQPRPSNEIARLVEQRNQKRPFWKKALRIGRTTSESLQNKEKQEGDEYLDLLNKGDFMGAMEFRIRHMNNKTVAGEPGTDLWHKRFAEGYKYATPQQIAEALSIIHPDAIAQYPQSFKEHPAVRKKILRSVRPEQLEDMGFSHFSDRVKEYQKSGLLSPKDVREIYSRRGVQREIQQTFERLLGPNSVLGSEESRELAPKRLAEFIEAGAITQKQAENFRRKYKF